MKKIILIMILALVLCVPLVSAENDAQWDNDLGGFNGLRNGVVGHNHNVEDANYELGVGVDVIVWEANEVSNKFLPDAVTLESKWDFENDNGSSYVVATFNLGKLLQ